MKTLSIIIILTFFFNLGIPKAQNKEEKNIKQKEYIGVQEPNDEVPTYIVVEKMPEFPGGELALRKFIAKNIEYPAIYQECAIQGTVYLKFVVLKSGKVGKIQLLRGTDSLLDKEAIRVIKLLPDFKPGEHKGKKVNVWYSIPIRFQLN